LIANPSIYKKVISTYIDAAIPLLVAISKNEHLKVGIVYNDKVKKGLQNTKTLLDLTIIVEEMIQQTNKAYFALEKVMADKLHASFPGGGKKQLTFVHKGKQYTRKITKGKRNGEYVTLNGKLVNVNTLQIC